MNTETTTTTEGAKPPVTFDDVAAASAENEAAERRKKLEEKFPPKKITKEIVEPLSDEDVAARGRELGEITLEIASVEEEKKEAVAGFSERLKDLKAKQKILAEEMEEETGKVSVACTMTWLWETNTVQTRRDDTGEVVHERPITPEEKQLDMFGAPVTSVAEPAEVLDAAKAESEDAGDDETEVADVEAAHDEHFAGAEADADELAAFDGEIDDPEALIEAANGAPANDDAETEKPSKRGSKKRK